LGGIAFELLGMKGAYTMSALVQFACAFAMAGLVYQQVAHELRLLEIPRQIAEGLSYAWTKPTILLVLGVTVITNAFAFAYSGLVAPLGLGEFRVSPTLVGLLAAAEPIGALIGGALIAGGVVRFDRRLTFAGGSSLFMAALVVMALSPSYWLAFAVLVLGGLGTAGFGNMQTTLMLTEAPAAMRSRLMGMVTVGIGTGPLGVLVAGALSEQWGPRTAVAFMAALGLAATVALALWLRRR
jgi:predicted MFS family arabinose efflux permease